MQRSPGRSATRAVRRVAGATLLELLVVVAVLATLGGAVLFSLDATERGAREDVRTVELTRIRDAVLKFRADTGQTPRLLAELLQSPDAADPLGGWWWRGPADPPLPAATWDPATRRGWSGPYLVVEHRTPDVAGSPGEAREERIGTAGALAVFDSDAAAGRRLAILLAPGQSRDAPRIACDWRLDLSDPAEARVTFLGAASRPSLAAETLGLGVRP